MQRIIYYVKERVFNRNHYIYHEGDDVDGIYFIKTGEYEISQKLK